MTASDIMGYNPGQPRNNGQFAATGLAPGQRASAPAPTVATLEPGSLMAGPIVVTDATPVNPMHAHLEFTEYVTADEEEERDWYTAQLNLDDLDRIHALCSFGVDEHDALAAFNNSNATHIGLSTIDGYETDRLEGVAEWLGPDPSLWADTLADAPIILSVTDDSDQCELIDGWHRLILAKHRLRMSSVPVLIGIPRPS